MWYDLQSHKFNSPWQFCATLSKQSDALTSASLLQEAEDKQIKMRTKTQW